MPRKLLITIVTVVVVAVCVIGAGALISGTSPAVAAINETSACPATGCVTTTCHGFDNIPEPNGVSLMYCPETDCSDVECHAWDTLIGRYNQASSASLALWIVVPVVIVVVAVMLMRRI